MTTEQVAEIIQGYAKQNIHIEVICDGFKSIGQDITFRLDMPVCYRGVIHYLNQNGQWVTDDIGCYGEDWQAAFDDVVEYAVVMLGASEQFYCSSYKDGEWRCKTQCGVCSGRIPTKQ